MFCPNCGREISNESRFCSFCGENVNSQYHNASESNTIFINETPDNAPALKPVKQKNSNIIIVIAVILSVLLLGCIAIFTIALSGSGKYDATFKLNTICVFGMNDIKDGENCVLEVDLLVKDASVGQFPKKYTLTSAEKYVNLDLPENTYIFKFTYRDSEVNYKCETVDDYKNKSVVFNPEKPKKPVVSTEGSIVFRENELEMYRPVFEEYKELITLYDKHSGTNSADSKEIVSFIDNHSYIPEGLKCYVMYNYKFYYVFKDIDNNGICELFINATYKQEKVDDNSIFAVYTIKDDNIIELISATYYSCIIAYDSGYLMLGDEGKTYYYLLSEDKTCVKKQFSYEYTGSSDNSDGYIFYDKNDKKISKDEFNKLYKQASGCDFGNYETGTQSVYGWKKVSDINFDDKEPTNVTSDSVDNSEMLKAYHDRLVDVYENIEDYDTVFSVEGNKFVIADVDSDGQDELIVSFEDTAVLAQISKIWKYDPATKSTKELSGGVHAYITFFKNGYIEDPISHNQSMDTTIWPCTINKIDGYEIKELYYVRCMDIYKYNDYDDYKKYDEDNDGVLYCISEGIGNIDSEKYYTKKEYEDFINKYIPESNKINLDFKYLTMDNINAIIK